MDKFRAFLEERKFSKEKIKSTIPIVEKFEKILIGADHLKSITVKDIDAFSELLIKEKLNTFDNYFALMYYARFIKNDWGRKKEGRYSRGSNCRLLAAPTPKNQRSPKL